MKGGRKEGEKVRRKIRRLKASIPSVRTAFFKSYNIRHFASFSDDSIQSKKSSGGPKGLIGPPCHGAWPPEAEKNEKNYFDIRWYSQR
jgi:hypothetical protein